MTHNFAIVIDNKRCFNCQACTVACRARNNVPEGKSRNWVKQTEFVTTDGSPQIQFEPGQCMQCEYPPCERVCPTGATYINKDGIVLVNYDICIGCRYCMLACPYDARYFDEETGVVDKCDFCFECVEYGEEPSCVTTCFGKARIFGDLNDPNSEVSRLLSQRQHFVLKPEAGTSPKIYYLI